MSLSADWGPSYEVMAAANFTCNLDTKLFINPCSPLFQCFYDEALGDVDDVSTCHCGTIGRFSNDQFPDCQHDSDMSWLPKVMGIVNVSVCGITIVWSIWMFVTLHKLQQLQFNDITKALVLTTLAVTFEIVHQSCETMQMFMKDPVSHLTFYGTPGIAQTTLSGMGCCMVLSDLNIPLLWMQIASSGMNKADAERRKKKVKDIVKYSGTFFFVTFVAIVTAKGTGMAGIYSILWILIVLVAFNVGSRKLRSQLSKPGEEEPKTSKDIKFYVMRLSVFIVLYICNIIWFFTTGSSLTNANPDNWQVAASLIYFCLAQCSLQNTIYIRSTLEKKLARFKKNGNRVLPTTTASGMSSVSSVDSN